MVNLQFFGLIKTYFKMHNPYNFIRSKYKHKNKHKIDFTLIPVQWWKIYIPLFQYPGNHHFHKSLAATANIYIKMEAVTI